VNNYNVEVVKEEGMNNDYNDTGDKNDDDDDSYIIYLSEN
jgi:hypothetical protein